MKRALLFLVLVCAPGAIVAQERLEQSPGWKVVTDVDLFGETFVREFANIAPKFAEMGYGQRVPKEHQPTLAAVGKKYGKPERSADDEVTTGMSPSFQPEKEVLSFHYYGRLGLGVSKTNPEVVVWVQLKGTRDK